MTQSWGMLVKAKEKVIEIRYINSELVTYLDYDEEIWRSSLECLKNRDFIEFNDFILRTSEILLISIQNKVKEK